MITFFTANMSECLIRIDFGWSIILRLRDNGMSSRWIDNIYVSLL